MADRGPGRAAQAAAHGIGVLLLHRSLAAHAVIAGMHAALRCGRLETDLVAVEARRSVDAARPVAVVTAPAAVSGRFGVGFQSAVPTYSPGRLTPASIATSFALCPSSRHSTIRARLATTASTDRERTTVDGCRR